MFKVAFGHSEDPDTDDAINEVIAQCHSILGDIQPQAGIVLSAVDYDYPVVLKKIREAFPTMQLIGCSSGGELSSRLGYTEGSLILITFASDHITMATAVARDLSHDVSKSVDEALKSVKQKLKDEPVLCLVFPDNFTVGTVRLVEELQNSLGANFPILGGGASDPGKFSLTREFYEEEILRDAAPMLFFAGPLDYTFNVISGWEPFTSKKPIMEANKNVVYKIGDESALGFYKHYLNGPPTLAHPLAVFEEGQLRFYLRAPMQIDEEKGSIVFGGDLPQQAATSICQADPAKLIEETHRLIEKDKPYFTHSDPACALIVSCACRQKILGTKTKEEYKVLREALPENTPIFGFYAYGQICPFDKTGPSFVHNDSIFALLLNEKT